LIAVFVIGVLVLIGLIVLKVLRAIGRWFFGLSFGGMLIVLFIAWFLLH